MLTEQQIKHFHTLGFLVFRQVFNQDELNTIHGEFEAAMEAAYRHAPFDGTRRHWLPMMGPETPFFVPGYVCKSEPGDVVAFDMRCWHASWGGSEDRRMCTIVYYNNPKTPEEDAATRNRARSNAKSPEHFNRPGTSLYDPHWVANPGGSKRRQRWIDRLRELEFLGPV